MTTAIVVGSGPNGLAAAVRLARSGVEVSVLEADDRIGGGTRSSELTLPGLVHDHCSAFHPMALASPFLRQLRLERHGLRWRWPEVDLGHPLDGGRAAIMFRSVEATAAALGADAAAWERLFGGLAEGVDALAEDVLRPALHRPRHPLLLARFGLLAAQSATLLTRRWRSEEAPALFAGVAAHAIRPPSSVASSAIGLMLVAAGHRHGWPVAEGGSQAIADALARELNEHGGRIETGLGVTALADLPPSDIVMLDLAPRAVAQLAGDRLPPGVRRAYRRYRHGPGCFKLDLAVEGGIPWLDRDCRRAGTIHVGGTLADIALAEREVQRGRIPERPFVLVGQQYLADPSRSAGAVHPVWAYAHVPSGCTADVSDLVLDHIERFAPGLRERILARSVRTAAAWPAYNPNVVGGDILTGANTPWQLAVRPRLARDPYATGIPGVYICSAATPPGAGVHGMCGFHAAGSALRRLERRR